MNSSPLDGRGPRSGQGQSRAKVAKKKGKAF
jgi:hypothetical protein